MPNPTQSTRGDEMRQEMQRKFQFWHRNCPADHVVDGQADLDKCTCGLDGAINDCLASLRQLQQREIREAEIETRIKEAEKALILHAETEKYGDKFEDLQNARIRQLQKENQ